jgi:hypothetical protein
MCKVVWPELIEDDEVVIIPLFWGGKLL